jgi:glycosyltransferase involved in cell wall biosynthesis
MAEALRALGHDVSFLHLQQPLGDEDPALRAYWGDRLYVFRDRFPASWIRRGRRKLFRLTARTLHLDLPVDAYFDPAAARYLAALVDRRPFDVVVVLYVFYSRLLESLPPGVRRLLDTQDVFSNRYRLYGEHGQAREFFSTSPEQEGKALDRANTVIAIQEGDARHFRSVSRTPVRVVGDLAPPLAVEPRGRTAGEPALLFVGGPMGINVHGVSWFIEQVLPIVRGQVPDAELWLVGGISDRIRRPGPGVRRFGFVESLEDLYRRAALVINPQRFGTGLSIKSVDALRRGRPLVTMATGARGLEEGAGTAFLQGESAEELARHVVSVLRDPELAAALGERAVAFAQDYHRRNLQALADVVNGPDAR